MNLGHALSRVEFFPPRRIYADHELHRAIMERFGYRGGTFLEAGANDGLKGSNSVYLERHLGWRGILVEPIPIKAEACRVHRPEAQTFHCALVPFSFQAPEIEMAFANLMSLSALSEIPIAGHIGAARPHMGRELDQLDRRFMVPARTAQSVIDEAGNPEIDLFVLDVEGAERSVLEGIDFTRTRPRNMIVEVRDLPSVAGYLTEWGYGPPERLTRMDYLFH